MNAMPDKQSSQQKTNQSKMMMTNSIYSRTTSQIALPKHLKAEISRSNSLPKHLRAEISRSPSETGFHLEHKFDVLDSMDMVRSTSVSRPREVGRSLRKFAVIAEDTEIRSKEEPCS